MSTLVVLGALDANWQEALRAAASAAAMRPHFAATWEDVPAEVIGEVRAVVLGDELPRALRAAERLRADERLERAAVLVVGPSVTASDYVECLTCGVDDVLSSAQDAVGLERRLQVARDAGAGAVRSLRRGQALVIGATGARAAARVRALGSAGFRAKVESEGTMPWLTDPRLALTVWEPSDPERAFEAIRAARAEGVLGRFVLCLGSEQAARWAAACESLDGVRVLPDTSPPDSVVFLVNEMAETTVQNQRASRRRLASTLVHFRSAGRSDLGLSYNVSAGGLYVRTLAPPSAGPVEVSVRIGSAQADFSCELAWSRALSHDGTATAPPGFGVRILEASESARALLATLGAS